MKWARESWSRLLEFAVLLVAAILLFVWTAPRLTAANEESVFVHAVEFIGAVLIILVLVTAHRSKWSLRRLSFATAISLITAIVSFFVYRVLIGLWTCADYDGRGPIVVGSTMLPGARSYADENHLSACRMVQDYAGDTGAIWSYSELLTRHLVLAALFMTTVLLFVLCAVLSIEMYRLWSEDRASAGGVTA